MHEYLFHEMMFFHLLEDHERVFDTISAYETHIEPIGSL